MKGEQRKFLKLMCTMKVNGSESLSDSDHDQNKNDENVDKGKFFNLAIKQMRSQ